MRRKALLQNSQKQPKTLQNRAKSLQNSPKPLKTRQNRPNSDSRICAPGGTCLVCRRVCLKQRLDAHSIFTRWSAQRCDCFSVEAAHGQSLTTLSARDGRSCAHVNAQKNSAEPSAGAVSFRSDCRTTHPGYGECAGRLSDGPADLLRLFQPSNGAGSSRSFLSSTSLNSSASGRGSFFSEITGHSSVY